MQYCSLNEAWKSDKMSTQYKQYNTNKKPLEIKFPTNIETFSEPTPVKKQDKVTCDRVMKHILRCKKCQRKMKEKFGKQTRSNIISLFDSLQNILDEYKDMIVLVLVGLFIIIAFNMISNKGKSEVLGMNKMTGGGFVPIPYHYYPQLGYQKFN